jgi:hypothetical protein
MRGSWRAYRAALWRHSKTLISGAASGLLGIVLSIHPVALPAWFWFLIALASLGWVSFVAFHDVHTDRERLRAVVDGHGAKLGLLEALSMQIEMGRHVENLIGLYDDDFSPAADDPNPFIAFAGSALGNAREWETDTYDWLRQKVGQLHATRFRNDIGVPIQYARSPSASAPLGVGETRKMIQRRLFRLDEITRELER